MGSLKVKAGGSWATSKAVSVKVSGSWKSAKQVWARANGSWISVWTSRGWKTGLASMAYGRNLAGVASPDGRYWYVMGGQPNNGTICEVYDKDTNTWSTRPALPSWKYGLGGAYYNGTIFGIAGTGSTVVKLNLAANTWSLGTEMAYPRDGGSVQQRADNKVYVAMGMSSGTAQSILEIYDLVTNVWTTLNSAPQAKQYTASALVGNDLYVMGGGLVNGAATTSAHRYNAASNSWTTLSNMANTYHYAAMRGADGKIYSFVGGACEVYDPAVGGAWSTQTMDGGGFVPTDCGRGQYANMLFVIGGNNGGTAASLFQA